MGDIVTEKAEKSYRNQSERLRACLIMYSQPGFTIL